MVVSSMIADSVWVSLFDIARLFLRLGATSFGGPAVHVAMMQDEIVVRREWLTREEFLDLLGAANLIPGPNSTEMAIHVGYKRAGLTGLVVAGVAFILPAFLMVWALAFLYVRYRSLPQANAVLYGVKPVVVAIVIQALWSLVRTAVKSRGLAVLAVAAVALSLLGLDELVLLVCAGTICIAARSIAERRRTIFSIAPVLATVTSAPAALGLAPLFLVFLKIGSILFGSGYVLIAFLRADFVQRLGWLTESQLLDAVAIGQITPGPLFTTATFIGYLLSGTAGAIVSTVGIFLPAFVLVALSGPLVPRLRRSPTAGAFLDGVNVASLALMAIVAGQMTRASLVDPWTIALAVASAVALFRFRVNSLWLMLMGAIAGSLIGLLARLP
jgi:chromate transporter